MSLNHAEWSQVAKVAQGGFMRLQQELVAAGATEQQTVTILLSYAQLAAELQGVVVENTSLPGEVNVSLN